MCWQLEARAGLLNRGGGWVMSTVFSDGAGVFVGIWVPGASRDGMGLGAERDSLPLADAVPSCAPRPWEVQPAGEGAVGVGATSVALSCAKSRSIASSTGSVQCTGPRGYIIKVWKGSGSFFFFRGKPTR